MFIIKCYCSNLCPEHAFPDLLGAIHRVLNRDEYPQAIYSGIECLVCMNPEFLKRFPQESKTGFLVSNDNYAEATQITK